jgi:predicted short-subunit dehydrogenase-like oxidoreductase (DUF2520 family)
MAAITLIGSGNVAWHLGKAFVNAGHRINEVYSRNYSNAKALADLFPGSTILTNTDFSKSNSEVFIIAISDNAIENVVAEITIPQNAIIVHTSGSVAMQVLNKFSHHGVFYALQTFTKGKETNLSEVPFGIEASDDFTFRKLTELALTLSKKVQAISSAQRKIIHIAAVFACNFTNHLFSISETILKKEQLDFVLLESLIKETVAKSIEIGPKKAQTGPAIRGDEK